MGPRQIFKRLSTLAGLAFVLSVSMVQLLFGLLLVGAATSVVQAQDTKMVLIGGIEQSGYSSLGQNTNPFVQAYIEGPDKGGVSHWVNGWGRIRLLGTPQPSTQGIVSTFTDPTGQLTKQDYSKVGESLDFVLGTRVRLVNKSDRWSFIAGFGVTTPLNSQDVTLTYAAPPPNTQECTTLTSRFTAKNGYNPGLIAAPPGSATCLAGFNGALPGYTTVAFSNQDRSGFLLKYGAGFRTSATFDCDDNNGAAAGSKKDCFDSPAVLDLTFGQDESVTQGMLRHVVFKLEGLLPLKTGDKSYLYLFGSAYIRLARNQDLSPLILKTATGVTIPDPSVIVLPLRIPDRDFYRLGVGLDLTQIFCKMGVSTTCSTKK